MLGNQKKGFFCRQNYAISVQQVEVGEEEEGDRKEIQDNFLSHGHPLPAFLLRQWMKTLPDKITIYNIITDHLTHWITEIG